MSVPPSSDSIQPDLPAQGPEAHGDESKKERRQEILDKYGRIGRFKAMLLDPHLKPKSAKDPSLNVKQHIREYVRGEFTDSDLQRLEVEVEGLAKDPDKAKEYKEKQGTLRTRKEALTYHRAILKEALQVSRNERSTGLLFGKFFGQWAAHTMFYAGLVILPLASPVSLGLFAVGGVFLGVAFIAGWVVPSARELITGEEVKINPLDFIALSTPLPTRTLLHLPALLLAGIGKVADKLPSRSWIRRKIFFPGKPASSEMLAMETQPEEEVIREDVPPNFSSRPSLDLDEVPKVDKLEWDDPQFEELPETERYEYKQKVVNVEGKEWVLQIGRLKDGQEHEIWEVGAAQGTNRDTRPIKPPPFKEARPQDIFIVRVVREQERNKCSRWYFKKEQTSELYYYDIDRKGLMGVTTRDLKGDEGEENKPNEALLEDLAGQNLSTRPCLDLAEVASVAGVEWKDSGFQEVSKGPEAPDRYEYRQKVITIEGRERVVEVGKPKKGQEPQDGLIVRVVRDREKNRGSRWYFKKDQGSELFYYDSSRGGWTGVTIKSREGEEKSDDRRWLRGRAIQAGKAVGEGIRSIWRGFIHGSGA